MAKLTRKRKIVLIILVLILAATGLAFLINDYFYGAWLRGQFGDLFDFSEYTVEEGGADDLEGIIAKYEPVFESLEESALERLDELYRSAIEEYREQDQSGTLDRFQLANKYLQAGRLLEKTVDEAFYGLLKGMEKELEYNDLPAAIVKDIEETYQQAKEDKKEELFGKVREELGY